MRQLKITSLIVDRDDTEKYLNNIRKIPMISPAEEISLSIRIQNKDIVALEKLVLANLRFVVSVAKQYRNQGLLLGDLINEGNIGLIKAAQRFDHTRGFKFISYAVWWVRQSIMQAIAESGRMVRLPQNKRSMYIKAMKMVSSFEQEYEHEPSIDEIADTIGVKDIDIVEVFNTNVYYTPLNVPAYDEGDTEVIDLLQEKNRTDDDLNKEDLTVAINRVLNSLSNKEADILRAHFKIGNPPPTVEEVMDKYRISREATRQIKQKAINKLGQGTRANILRQYLG